MQGESAFDFHVLNPEHRSKGGKLDLSYWAYHVRAHTLLPQYARKDMEVTRRYSDFEWLRTQLSEEYTWCIVPPVPEKAVKGTLEKFVGGAHDPQLLDYRQRALRKFLVRVGAHPHLYNSQLLQDFLEMDEGEWERRMKAPHKPQPERSILAVLGETGNALAQQWAPNQVTPTGASYSKALTEKTTNPQVWEETKGYVGQLQASLQLLRDRLETLVKRRKETGSSLHEFGVAFARVGEIEGSMLQGPLSNALVAIGQHSQALSSVYGDHAEQETKQVVETLTYYLGMCNSVRETLKRVTNALQLRDQLQLQAKDASLNRDKLVSRGATPDKVAKAEVDMKALADRRDAAASHVEKMEALFKDELRRFHREKQYDIKSMLKSFVELQLDYANKMKRSWEQLLPCVEQVKL